MIDADKTAFSAIRVMVNMDQTREAAGVAAYIALDSSCPVQEMDIKRLQRELEKGGSMPLADIRAAGSAVK